MNDQYQKNGTISYAALMRSIDGAPDRTSEASYLGRLEKFRTIRIEHPRLRRVRSAMNDLRAEARLFPGKEQYVLPVIGPSQSGKTFSIDDYIETVVKKEMPKPGHIPVLRVNLSPRSTLKQLQADILAPLVRDENGEFDPKEMKYGTEASFRQKVRRYALLRRTEAICIDESQHLLRFNAMERAKAVADTIKLMAIEGAAGFVVVGTEEAWQIFRSNDHQTALRCMEPIFLKPLDYAVEWEAADFEGYVASLDEALWKAGITDSVSGFVEGDMSACFWEVSRGVIGRVSRLVRLAWNYGYKLNRPTVDRDLFAAAVDRWAIPLGFCKFNPFREGARELEIVKSEWAKDPLGEEV